MGKEVYRPLIADLELSGTDVYVTLALQDSQKFVLPLLEQYLDYYYQGSNITVNYDKWNRISGKIRLSFATAQDALQFYLSH